MERAAEAFEAEKHIGRAHVVDRMLKDYNDKLELVWVGEKATTPGLVPCRWHVRYHDRDKGAMAAYSPGCGQDGSYREPESSTVEWMRSMCLENRDMVEEIRKA